MDETLKKLLEQPIVETAPLNEEQKAEMDKYLKAREKARRFGAQAAAIIALLDAVDDFTEEKKIEVLVFALVTLVGRKHERS